MLPRETGSILAVIFGFQLSVAFRYYLSSVSHPGECVDRRWHTTLSAFRYSHPRTDTRASGPIFENLQSGKTICQRPQRTLSQVTSHSSRSSILMSIVQRAGDAGIFLHGCPIP